MLVSKKNNYKEDFKNDFELILNHSMLGATKVNQVLMTIESMNKIIKAVYYGTSIDF